MEFIYNKTINEHCWQRIINAENAFGMNFPKTFNITKKDEIKAKEQTAHFAKIWRKYSKEITNGIKEIYGEFPKIICYIITCQWSMDGDNYIAISMYRDDKQFITSIAHEINHVMFRKQFSEICENKKVDIERAKEIVTVINNAVLPSVFDVGYKTHFKERINAYKVWEKTHNIKKVVEQIK